MRKGEARAEAIRQLLGGTPEEEVRDWLRSNYGPRKTPHLLRQIHRELAQLATADPKVRLGLIILSLDEVYRRAMEAGNLAQARLSRVDLVRLLGLEDYVQPALEEPGDETLDLEEEDDLEELERPEPRKLGELLQLVRKSGGPNE